MILTCGEGSRQRIFLMKNLQEGWVGVDEQLLEVGLEPLTGFWGRLESIGLSAVGVVSDGRGVGGTVTLTTWLDPDISVKERISGWSIWAETESSSDSIAPISPSELTGWLLSGSTLVDDEVSWETVGLEDRSKSVNVTLLVAVGVSLSVRWAGRDGPGIVVGNVGSKTTEGLWRSGILVKVGVVWTGQLQVGWPSEPSSVTSIDVHGDVWQVELLKSIGDTLFVGLLGIGTLLDVGVGNHVGQAVWLNDEGDWDIWVKLELSDESIDVLALISGNTVVGNGEFTVGSESSAVTVWKIVDDEGTDYVVTGLVLGTDLIEVSGQGWDLGNGVEPDIRWNGGDCLGSSSQRSLASSD